MNSSYTQISKLYIGNERVALTSGALEAILNPATEKVIGHAPICGLAEVDAATRAARRAFDSGPWPRMTVRERAGIIRRMHAAFVRRLPESRR